MLPAGDFPAATGGPTGTVRDAMPGWDPGVSGGKVLTRPGKHNVCP